MTNEELITKLLKKVYEQDEFLNELRVLAEKIYMQARHKHKLHAGETQELMQHIIRMSDTLDERSYLSEDE